MSETVSKALLDSHDTSVEETAKFIDMIDKFFDSLNVTNISSGRKKRKPFQSPYRKLGIKIPFGLRYAIHVTVSDNSKYDYKCMKLAGLV